jgi:hypothetical protein
MSTPFGLYLLAAHDNRLTSIVYDPTASFSENETNSIRVWEEFANDTNLVREKFKMYRVYSDEILVT